MDFTPQLQDISEDSGCLTSSTVYGEKSTASRYLETPTTTDTVTFSRKRKCSFHHHVRSMEISDESPAIFETHPDAPSSFLSSTLNESLSKSLEKCNLGDYTPNFYVEREFNGEQSLKKFKSEDSPTYQPKTRSAPSTPTKHLEENDLYVRQKSQSGHLNGAAPTKSSYKYKLGSPERLELLYPNIKSITSPMKLRTPEKLREFIKKVNSPAKKRLFKNCSSDGYLKKVCRDPISVLLVKNDFRHVVSQIFSYLSEPDLCNVSRVSRTWRRALLCDHNAFPRFYAYSLEFNSNKENISKDVSMSEKTYSPPSPVRDSFHKCTKIASQLRPNQSLQKCLRCMEPAIIQRSISQCQNPNCEYIYCMRCLSFSTTGPEHFVDKCHTSELVIHKPNLSSRFSLYDISNGSGSDMHTSKYDSSGYLSENEFSPIMKVKQNPIKNSNNLTVFQNISNLAEKSVLHRKSRRSSLVTVVGPSSTPTKFKELVEPSSPPKVSIVACSKQSKRNLKRLQF